MRARTIIVIGIKIFNFIDSLYSYEYDAKAPGRRPGAFYKNYRPPTLVVVMS
jgi:hypothetical protein